MALDDIRRDREVKLGRYEAVRPDAFPATVKRNFLIGEVRQKFKTLATKKKAIAIVGRLRALREHGGSAFGDLEDGSGVIQLFFSRDELNSAYDFFLESVDIGDFLEIIGQPFRTKRGEETMHVGQWRMIAKSFLPLPEKWHGLKDVEERFRKRYLDLVMNPEVRERFRFRSNVIRNIRSFLDAEGFEEVETPFLHAIPGGALAKPFRTHHNALDVDLYLRIAPELYLKRLVVGGLERVYELGKVFRNEGVDATHNPEYTLLEFYAAYWDEQVMMDCVERLFVSVAKKQGKKLAPKKFPRISFVELLKRYAFITDYKKETMEGLRLHAQRFGVDVSPGATKGKLADEIFEKICRPKLEDPVFVTDFPLDISPLSKMKDQSHARRFNLIVGGKEIADGWAELNDPRDQEVRFRSQESTRQAGDEEAHRFDAEFIEALEHGMPPVAGVGIGIDRLVMLLTDAHNIREVVLFPTMRSR